MRHTCKDGQATKLVRSGPVGTTEGVTFSCPRCGQSKSAADIERETIEALNRRLAIEECGGCGAIISVGRK